MIIIVKVAMVMAEVAILNHKFVILAIFTIQAVLYWARLDEKV